MKLIGLVRLGHDAEIRYTPAGLQICEFSGAFNYGRKADGEKYRPSQWVKFALFGDRADRLVEFLTKGRQVFVVASDPHVEEFERREGGMGWKFVARVDSIDLVGDAPAAGDDAATAPAPRQPSQASSSRAPTPQQRAASPRSASGTGFDDMDDDVPF